MIPFPFIRERTGADPLIEGFYLIRRSGRVAVPVKIWFGAPLDEDGEELDRSHRWQIQVGFALLDEEPMRIGGVRIEHLDDLWPACAREPVDEAEWRFLLDRAAWASEYDENDALGHMGEKIDPMTVTLP